MEATRTQLAKGLGVSVGAFTLFGVVTGLVPNPIYVRMVPRTVPDYVFLVLTSLLVGAYAVQEWTKNRAGNDGLALGSVVGGFLAFGCPICNVFLLALFGSSTLMTSFDPYRPILGVVSVLALGGLVYYRHVTDCEVCET